RGGGDCRWPDLTPFMTFVFWPGLSVCSLNADVQISRRVEDRIRSSAVPVCRGDSAESILTDRSITNIFKPWLGLESSIGTKQWTALRALSGRKATPRLLPRTCSLP